MTPQPEYTTRRVALMLTVAFAVLMSACGGGGGAKEPTVPITPVQPGPTDPLSSIVDSIRRAWNLPAMGGAIVTLEQGVTAVAVAGTRRATGGPAASKDDLWHLGSNTKAITSLLAAVAVSENRIQWTTTVAQAFPELSNIRLEYRDVTLRDLLSHQSGFPRDVNVAISEAAPTPAQRTSAVTWAVQQSPGSARGTYAYSNLGYHIAAAMLDRAFGTSYEDAMAARVYGPLGITDAGWGPQAAAGSATQPVAHSWIPSGSWTGREAFDNPPVNNSSGRAHMSLASWGRLLREILRVEAGAPTLAAANVAAQLTSSAVTLNATTSYGMGWLISTRTWANGKVLFHDGSNGANHSLAFVAPQRNVAFLATTNAYDAPGGRSTMALDALIGRLNVFHTTGK